jgi:ribosome-associated protein
MIRLNRGIVIDERELEFDFIRSSGPGGQNVNKVSTAVRLRFDARGSSSLPEDMRARLIRLAGRRFGDDGFLTIHARTGRTQESNRRDAIERLVELLEKAAVRPTPRRATKPTLASRKRRLDTKRRRGETKQARRPREPGED